MTFLLRFIFFYIFFDLGLHKLPYDETDQQEDENPLQGGLKKCKYRTGDIDMLVKDIFDQPDHDHGHQHDQKPADCFFP